MVRQQKMDEPFLDSHNYTINVHKHWVIIATQNVRFFVQQYDVNYAKQ